jgi:hypothetical protein
MPVVVAGDGGRFGIVLPAGATNAQQGLKARFDPLREALTAKLGIPDYPPLLQRLQDAARVAFDGENGAAPNPDEGLIRLGAVQTDMARLDARPGRFVVVLPPSNDPDRGREIVFQRIGDTTPAPADQLDLFADIAGTLTVLEVILPPGAPPGGPGDRFDQYRVKLFSLAQVGLQGSADPKVARQGLTALQAEILAREGPRVKNDYMIVLGAWAIGFALVGTLIYFALRWWAPHDWLLYDVRNIFVLWVGTMIGTWLSFGIRRAILTMKDLSTLEADMVGPPIRLVFTGLIAGTLGLVFICAMVNVDIGGLHSADLLSRGSRALLIGILMGVSEQALPATLTRRASQFVTEIGGRT